MPNTYWTPYPSSNATSASPQVRSGRDERPVARTPTSPKQAVVSGKFIDHHAQVGFNTAACACNQLRGRMTGVGAFTRSSVQPILVCRHAPKQSTIFHGA